jgi:predicted nucleotidyltransferase
MFFKCLQIQYLFTTMPKTDLYQLVASKKSEISELAAQYGASHIRIFGSVARHSSDDQSDIDFLVEMEPGRTLFDLGGLSYDLEVLLKRRVDVCTVPLLREQVRERIISEAIPL